MKYKNELIKSTISKNLTKKSVIISENLKNLLSCEIIIPILHLGLGDKKNLKKLKVKEDLYNFSDLSKSSILTLAENDIRSLDDLAELDSEELFNLLGNKVFINEDDAGSVIMKARQHWFADENVDD